MKIAIMTCGMLPIPAVQGGAVENLIDFYLDYNNQKKLHDITIYSPRNEKLNNHPALSSNVNHYIYIDVASLKARIERRIYKYFHTNEYYNNFIEYYFEQVYKDLKKKDFDLIILENSPGHAYKLSQRGYKNIILHLHNDLLHLTSRYHNVISNSLTKVITVSDYLKKRVSTVYPSDKIQTIYNGIDLKSFLPNGTFHVSRKTLGFSEEDFVIVYNGRINKEKGISELIDALLQLKEIPQIKLMALGSSFFDDVKNENTFVRSLKEKVKDIEDRVVFTGFVPYKKISEYLHLADIAVLPSIWEEPFGLTIVEAMATGLPLITTRSGGIPEICESVATIVERNNIVNSLTNAILDLYQDSEKRKQMAAASLQRAMLFDKESFAEKFFAALENL